MSLSGIDERPGRPLALGVAWMALLACACWAWFAFQGAAPGRPLLAGAQPLPQALLPAPLRAGQVMLLFVMWTGLCVGLMLPAAAGAVFVYLRVARRRAAVGWPRVATGFFAFGCLLAWTGFAALVTLLHWTLHDAGLLDPALAAQHPAGVLALVAAGAWQWTPAKHACLQACREPLSSVLADWRGSAFGALWQGAEHGRVCLGCCWLLVLLVVAGGPASPLVVGAVGLLLLAELRLEVGALASCVAGLAMVVWAIMLLFP